MPSTEEWWKGGWATIETPERSGGVHEGNDARNSARVSIRDPTAPASGTSSEASERMAARQEGSRPITGTPESTYGVKVSTVRRTIRRAALSWPVATQVSAQHAHSAITRTRVPAASSPAIEAIQDPGATGSETEPNSEECRVGKGCVSTA